MKAHAWHAIGWAAWAIATLGFFSVWEYIGLRSRTDDYQPLTYYVRKTLGTPNNPLWFVAFGIFAWFIYHFLFVHK